MAKRDKRARHAANIEQPKVVRQPEIAVALSGKNAKLKDPQIDGKPLAWRFSGKDGGGPYSWASLTCANKFRDIIDRLHEFETKNWQEILNSGCHPIEVGDLCKEARDRLVELEKDDIDDLMSFRISGAERVWAIQDQNIMRILWWDPNHGVYPTEKDKADRAKRRKRSK